MKIIMTDQLKFDEIIKINNIPLTKKYIESLSKEERLNLIDPIFKLLRSNGFIYPDDLSSINKEWKKLLEYEPDLSTLEVFNNSSLATNICKYFCHKFYLATEYNKPTMVDNFNDDDKLKRIIKNRLGLDWLESDSNGPGVNEAFNLSFKMIVFQGQRSMRFVNATSIFKPSIAKYLYMKYSNEGDTVFDYSAGWGARMLGAASCNRNYIGVDPWTTDELTVMKDFLNLKNINLINSGSEDVRLQENSIDFSFSSPPYYQTEVYTLNDRQAYTKGEDYFYNIYWKKTVNNIKYMLKPGKYFGLNILRKYDKMINIAKDVFGEPIEEVQLRTIKSHLGKNSNRGIDGIQKYEPIFIFKNNK